MFYARCVAPLNFLLVSCHPQLQLWIESPKEELTYSGALSQIEPPYNTDTNLIQRTHAFLARQGYINFGIFRRIQVRGGGVHTWG